MDRVDLDTILAAGMFGQPPGMIPAEVAAHWQASMPALRVQTIAETNHYTILFSPPAAHAIAAQLARD